MTARPLVYIIVLTWNGKEDTLECLRSLRHIRGSDFRVLVVDNASTDGTADAVRSEFPDVELLVNASNLRFAGGNNAGIRRALDCGATHVLLLNNDTIVDPDFLLNLQRGMDVAPAAGMAGPKIYYYADPRRLWYAGGSVLWWKGTIAHLGVREPDHGQYDLMQETGYITGCCLLVRREVIDRIGLLDESYFIYGEDADWCVRARRAGYGLRYVPSSMIWHKVSISTGGHLSWFKNWNKLKSQLRLLSRYAKPYHWLTIPFGLAASVVRGYVGSKRS